MARRKFGGFRRARVRSVAKRYARKAGIGRSASLVQVDAMLYGAARPYLAQALAPVASMLPIGGGLVDEISAGLATWLIAKNTSGMVRDVALKGLVVENARVGEALSSGIGLGLGSQQNSGYLYG